MSLRCYVAVLLGTVSILASAPSAEASAASRPLHCGQVITRNTTLTDDLTNCPGDGLVIGADGITLNLNGHTIDGIAQDLSCKRDCLSQVGIDNSGGHDRVRIRNGTVTDFEYDIVLDGADRNMLRDLALRLPAFDNLDFDQHGDGLGLLHADRNQIVNVDADGIDSAIRLAASDRNLIRDSSVVGVTSCPSLCYVALALVDDSDHNIVQRNALVGSYLGLEITDSGHNVVRANDATGCGGNRLLRADHNLLVGNKFFTNGPCEVVGGAGLALSASSDNVIHDNTATGLFDWSITADGNRNLISKNTSAGMTVSAGTGNVLRANTVTGCISPDPPIR